MLLFQCMMFGCPECAGITAFRISNEMKATVPLERITLVTIVYLCFCLTHVCKPSLKQNVHHQTEMSLLKKPD